VLTKGAERNALPLFYLCAFDSSRALAKQKRHTGTKGYWPGTLTPWCAKSLRAKISVYHLRRQRDRNYTNYPVEHSIFVRLAPDVGPTCRRVAVNVIFFTHQASKTQQAEQSDPTIIMVFFAIWSIIRRRGSGGGHGRRSRGGGLG
jgi:hypothetical protein